MNCEQARESVVDFALGALEGIERAAMVSHLSLCPTCQAEVSAMTGVVDDLVNLVPPVEAAPGFVDKVMAGLPRRQPVAPPRMEFGRRRPTGLRLVALAVTIFAGAVVAWVSLYQSGDNHPRRSVTGRRSDAAVLRVVSMRTPSGTPAGSALAFYGRSAWVYVSVTMPATPSGRYLSGTFDVVLVHRDGQLTPIGRVAIRRGQGSIEARAHVPLSQIGSVDVIDAHGNDLCAGSLSGGSLLHTATPYVPERRGSASANEGAPAPPS